MAKDKYHLEVRSALEKDGWLLTHDPYFLRNCKMDKVTKYKKIASDLVTEIASMMPSEEDGIENQLITDDQHGHYLLFSVGWESKLWHYTSFLHLDVKSNGCVWLQHDGTDQRVAEQLVSRGIPKSDIVVGFQPPYARSRMEDYAVA